MNHNERGKSSPLKKHINNLYNARASHEICWNQILHSKYPSSIIETRDGGTKGVPVHVFYF